MTNPIKTLKKCKFGIALWSWILPFWFHTIKYFSRSFKVICPKIKQIRGFQGHPFKLEVIRGPVATLSMLLKPPPPPPPHELFKVFPDFIKKLPFFHVQCTVLNMYYNLIEWHLNLRLRCFSTKFYLTGITLNHHWCHIKWKEWKECHTVSLLIRTHHLPQPLKR